MPIVRYQRQQTISAIDNSALIKKASTDEVSGAAVAETIGQSVEALAKRYGEIKKQQDEISLLNKSNQYDTFLTDKIIDIQTNKTGEKAFTALDDFKKDNTSYQSELSKDVSDPVQKAKLSNILSTRTNDANLKIATHVSQQRQVALNYGLQNTLDNTTKGVQSGLLSVSEGLDIIDTNVHGLATSGIFKSQEEVETKKADLKGKLIETYLDDLNIKNPAAVSEMLKNGTVTVRGQAVKYTNFLPTEKLNEIKKTAQVMEKSKSIEDERLKIEKGLQWVEKLEGNFSDDYIKGSLTRAHLLSSKPKDLHLQPSQVQNRYNSTIERFTGKLESREKANERLAKANQKASDNATYNQMYVRVITEPGDNNISTEDKISNYDIDFAVREGTIKPAWGAKLKEENKKSQQLANPLRQKMIDEAVKEINDAENNGTFGKKDSNESNIEKGKIIDAMNKWMQENPGKNPIDFTKELLAPSGISKVKEAINFAYKIYGRTFRASDDIYTEPTETPSLDVIKARQEDLLKGKTSKTTPSISPDEAKAENYLKQKGLPVTPANKKYIIDRMGKKK